MSDSAKKLLAIIPARGGSKRIAKKNIKVFRGHPIIAWSIKAAANADIFDTIMVSADCTEISSVASTYGATTPFKRSELNSNDYATITDVLMEVVSTYETNGTVFDAVCCLYATAPFITPPQLLKGLNLLMSENFNAVFPITPFDYPINRAFSRNHAGEISFREPAFLNTRSQDIPDSFHDSGSWIWFKPECLKTKDKLFSGKTGSIIVRADACHDIDTETDWKIATMKHQALFQDQNRLDEDMKKGTLNTQG